MEWLVSPIKSAFTALLRTAIVFISIDSIEHHFRNLLPLSLSSHLINLPLNEMRFLGLSLAVLASAAWTVLADEELKIDVTHKVECERKTKEGDNIAVHYKGTLTDGKVFDSSFGRNQPISFVVGTGRVIKGLIHFIYHSTRYLFKCSVLICNSWDQGLLDMCIGEKRTLTIPPSLGYGNRATGPIPAGSTLSAYPCNIHLQ